MAVLLIPHFGAPFGEAMIRGKEKSRKEMRSDMEYMYVSMNRESV
jgi:hypothetical protein